MENDSKINKVGRPTIGKQVCFTIPESSLTQIDEWATQAGVARADILRELVEEARRARTPREESPWTKTLAPLADTLATWIASGDEDTARARFIAFKRKAGKGYDLTRVIQTAYGTVMLDGNKVAIPDREAILLITSKGHTGWRSRTVLFFMVSNALTERGVKMRTGEDDDEGIEFDPEHDDDYA